MPKICVIVGAGEGLGQALAVKFASEGYDLALVSRTESGSQKAFEAAHQSAPNANIRFFPADATKPETLEIALSQIANEMGPVDVLLYNVRGEFTRCAPLDMSYEGLKNIYNVEVIGAFAAAKSVLPSMIKRGEGSIFFSSATAAFR